MKLMVNKFITGGVITGMLALAGWYQVEKSHKQDEHFVQALSDLRQNGEEVAHFVPSFGFSGGLGELVRREGINPTSRLGKLMIYDAMCNPENKEELYGIDAAACEQPTLDFMTPGITSGYVTLHRPTNELLKY